VALGRGAEVVSGRRVAVGLGEGVGGVGVAALPARTIWAVGRVIVGELPQDISRKQNTRYSKCVRGRR
jgi:hypothetical protein